MPGLLSCPTKGSGLWNRRLPCQANRVQGDVPWRMCRTAECTYIGIKAVPLRGTAARPSPRSTLPRPPGTGPPKPRQQPRIQQARSNTTDVARTDFLGSDCPARGHRI